MKEHIKEFIKKLNKYPILLDEFIKRYPEHFTVTLNTNISKEIENIDNKWLTVNNTMTDIKTVLDKSIYGHNRAKRQIERVIGQWITGKQSGYCFGFEGPPGVGKTSLARKGLANCLMDEDKTTRPFSFIALGGSQVMVAPFWS